MATYIRELGYEEKGIEEYLHNFCKIYLQNYNRVKCYKLIDDKVKKSKKHKLKKSSLINITQAELDIILGEENIKCQKLMFVYLVLAKYYMSNNHADKYYVGAKDSDIFSLCDMYVKKQDKISLMHYLTKNGYITPNLNMSSVVNYVNEDSEIVMSFYPDTDMVYYFERYIGGLFIECPICGKLAKKTNNKIKYCKECSALIKDKKILVN